jgi:hypothetical protein
MLLEKHFHMVGSENYDISTLWLKAIALPLSHPTGIVLFLSILTFSIPLEIHIVPKLGFLDL